MLIPEITRAPDMPPSVEGMVSLRGIMVPVINLQQFCGVDAEEPPNILVITEYNKHVQGFLVHSVDNIQRIARDDAKVPPPMMAQQHGGMVTAVTELPDDRLVMIMDVEMVLAKTAGFGEDPGLFESLNHLDDEYTVLFADDSSVARDQVTRTLDAMGVRHIACQNGKEAWERLDEIAQHAE